MVLSPTLAGLIQESTTNIQDGYFWVQIYFIGISCLALLSSITMWMLDKKMRDNILQAGDALDKFERYTEQTRLEKGCKTLMNNDPEDDED